MGAGKREAKRILRCLTGVTDGVGREESGHKKRDGFGESWDDLSP